MTQTLTPTQLEALKTFAGKRRTWKQELRQAWMTGMYPADADSASLQQIRNTFGPSWLVRFNLKAAAAAAPRFFAEIETLNLEAVERSLELGELNRRGLDPSKLEWFEARMTALYARRDALKGGK